MAGAAVAAAGQKAVQKMVLEAGKGTLAGLALGAVWQAAVSFPRQSKSEAFYGRKTGVM